MLQLHSHHPFFELREYRAYGSLVLTGEQILGQLLGDGTTAAAAAVATQKGLEEHTEQAARVDARMLVETDILGGYQSIYQIGRQLVVRHIRAVLDTDKTEYLAIGREHLCGLIALRVLQLLKGGHKTQPP